MNRKRILNFVLLGVICFSLSYTMLRLRNVRASDFQWTLRAAQAIREGDNPYTVMSIQNIYPLGAPYPNPLPAAYFGLLFSPFDDYIAGALFFTFSAITLAFAIVKSGQNWQLGILASSPLLVAGYTGQWTPLLLSGAFLPILQGFLWCKPTVGLATFIFRPSKKGFLVLFTIGIISLLIMPHWPFYWIVASSLSTSIHPIPILMFPGVILILALLCWRRKEAWVLLLMAIVPQTPFYYDQLMLWLIPENKKQLWFLNICSWLAYGYWFSQWGLKSMAVHLQTAQPVITWFIYLPCLGLLFWQENQRRPFRKTIERLALKFNNLIYTIKPNR